ncbi:hypothetical protein AB1Y20_013184 [Prymnesium parvum]|uniref:RNA-directed DNA polymerase n=1 Tax=Prymnesium parvum TaxID=97485 RepID=A0AB34IKZ6_PRYPA
MQMTDVGLHRIDNRLGSTAASLSLDASLVQGWLHRVLETWSSSVERFRHGEAAGVPSLAECVLIHETHFKFTALTASVKEEIGAASSDTQRGGKQRGDGEASPAYRGGKSRRGRGDQSPEGERSDKNKRQHQKGKPSRRPVKSEGQGSSDGKSQRSKEPAATCAWPTKQHILSNLVGATHVTCFTDSAATARGLTVGGSGSPQLNLILRWLFDRHPSVQFLGVHIPGVQNVASDNLSRGRPEAALADVRLAGACLQRLRPCMEATGGSFPDGLLHRLHADAIARLRVAFAPGSKGELNTVLRAFNEFARACPQRHLFHAPRYRGDSAATAWNEWTLILFAQFLASAPSKKTKRMLKARTVESYISLLKGFLSYTYNFELVERSPRLSRLIKALYSDDPLADSRKKRRALRRHHLISMWERVAEARSDSPNAANDQALLAVAWHVLARGGELAPQVRPEAWSPISLCH